ncbi:BMP family lipoprotein [Halomarina oriensis]|uniref:BMP family ABC transporter substrate-binding protein n=1 Tax=Halomarina oriensis TaxID=671145 RepID=A0A6B0GQF2_9EURY|nr:BMP family protein [Halomarina oriensis]MWG36900.1 BMP family ABC transporter substrate-binding protein [Halomarina oriensis]
MDRRKFLKGVGVAGVAGLAGCTGGPEAENESTEQQTGSGGGDSTEASTDAMTEGETTETTTEEESGGGGEGDVNVGMVYATGGLGDGSFNDQAQTGLQQAADEFGIDYNESEPSQPSEFSTFQQSYAESTDPNYDLVSCIGFLQAEALGETSSQFPDQDFMIVDAVVEADNVANYVFAEHEGSYLVGQMAGLLTTEQFSAGGGETNEDTVVGFVGGVESGLIERFEAGFTAGVQAANSDVEVLSTYVGDFNDPTGGQQAANSMYSRGADIVYHAAGNTGTGVFSAAQSAGRFAIGVDRDQSVTKSNFSDVILASMVKRVDTAVYNSIEAVVNDSFEGGATTALGLEQEGVGVVYGGGIGGQIPSGIKSQVEESRQAIIDGEVEVPTTL